MTQREAQARQHFIDIIVGEAHAEWARRDAVERAAYLILRHGATYKRIQEANCDGVGTYYNEPVAAFNARQERFERELERRERNLERRIRELVAIFGAGFGVVFHGDPRGATIKITVPSGRTTDWGGEGVCVPTA